MNQDQMASELFYYTPTKAQKRQLQIAEGAIESYVKHGLDKTTFETIAKASKVSRPLIQHYFSTKDELFHLVVRLIRSNLQQHAVEAIKALKNPEDPKEQMSAYIRATFSWMEKYHRHAQVWPLFYYKCCIDPDYRKQNTDWVLIGKKRIKAMIEAGVETKVFKSKDPASDAEMIQTMITGALIAALTEGEESLQWLGKSKNEKNFQEEQTVRRCLALLGA